MTKIPMGGMAHAIFLSNKSYVLRLQVYTDFNRVHHTMFIYWNL